jgi:selenide, water dikinase
MPLGRLAQVLRGIHAEDDPRLVVGPETFDDAGIVRLDPKGDPDALALVQTVDFFPPVVDDPYFYGAIAAANSLSDVYAMGGRPLSALTLAGFPKDFRQDWIEAIFRGGFEKVREAGAVVAGGHTVEGEILFGFAVTGLVRPSQMTPNSGARPGDLLFLTKRLGMGTLTTAQKRGLLDWQALLPAAQQMATLNRAGAEAMVEAHCRAATDVTGFGLLGHARNLGRASSVTLQLDAGRLPIFERALEFAAQGVASGGSKRNREALLAEVRVEASAPDALATLAFDAETSGGLLVAIAPQQANRFRAACDQRRQFWAEIGRVVPAGAHWVELA